MSRRDDDLSRQAEATMQIEQLAYSPAIQADETLWSWLTRVALYHGWSADEFLRLLGFGASSWDDHFRQVDVDCGSPNELLDRLAAVTGFNRSLLLAHQVESSARTLWLDDRVAFCESCWTDGCRGE
jgi:TniQ